MHVRQTQTCLSKWTGARSKLEHLRKKCSTTLALTRWADTDATRMMISCSHVPTTPVVFGRAWRRSLDHVHRVKINTWKTCTKNNVNEKYLQSLIKKYGLKSLPSWKKKIYLIEKHAKNTPKYFKKTPQSDPKWLLFGAWEPPWNHDATRVPNCALI